MIMTRIRISLLPAEMRRQSSIMKIWTIVAMVLAILAMILLAGNILLSLYIKEPMKELDRLKTEQQNITENIGRLSYIQEMFDEIESNNADIKELRGLDPDWWNVIDMTSANAGLFGIKVDRMEIVSTGETPGCKLTCWTNDLDNLKKWSSYMEGIDGIDSVQMTDINTNVISQNEIEFKFNVVIRISQWNAE